ncbi:MAG: hypothetical protein WCK48_00655 [bacterium]
MKKKKKRQLTETEEKDVDRFVDRLAEILLMQVEQEALAKELPGNDKKR